MIFQQSYSNRVIHPLATAWKNQVIANGSASPSTNTVRAHSILFKQLQSADLLNSVDVLNTFPPDNLIATLTPCILNVAGSNPFVNVNFAAGDLSIEGLSSDGSSKYLDSGILPTNNSTIIFSDVGFNVPIFVRHNVGSYNFANQCRYLRSVNYTSPDNAVWEQYGYDQSTIYSIYSSNSIIENTIICSKIDNSNTSIYKMNKSGFNLVMTNSPITGSIPTNTYYIFATNINGSYYGISNRTMSIFSILKNISDNKLSVYLSILNTFRKNIGGGFV